MTKRAKALLLAFVLLLAIPSIAGQSTNQGDEAVQSCRAFVQEFYDWYMRLAQKRQGMCVDLALKRKPDAFAPELRKRLQEDVEARAKAVGEIDGLDFDPFLSSQDPDQRYVVGEVVKKGANYWSDVHGVSSGKRRKAHVAAELSFADGQWRFVNFHYKNSDVPESDLLTILDLLHKDRETDQKK